MNYTYWRLVLTPKDEDEDNIIQYCSALYDAERAYDTARAAKKCSKIALFKIVETELHTWYDVKNIEREDMDE